MSAKFAKNILNIESLKKICPLKTQVGNRVEDGDPEGGKREGPREQKVPNCAMSTCEWTTVNPTYIYNILIKIITITEGRLVK